jgi:hypothetical protein
MARIIKELADAINEMSLLKSDLATCESRVGIGLARNAIGGPHGRRTGTWASRFCGGCEIIELTEGRKNMRKILYSTTATLLLALGSQSAHAQNSYNYDSNGNYQGYSNDAGGGMHYNYDSNGNYQGYSNN